MTATPMLRTPAPAPGIPPAAPGADDRDAGTLAVASAALRGGFVLLPRTLLHAPGLSRDAKLLYAVLLSYAWQEGRCFPGYARLQADLQCSVNSVTKWMQELQGARLVTRRRRGQGKTTVYTLHDPPAPPQGLGGAPAAQTPKNCESEALWGQSPKDCESALPLPAALEPQSLRPEYDPGGRDPEEHPLPVVQAPPSRTPRSTLAPTATPVEERDGAGDDDDALELLTSQGVTQRIAQELVRTHSPEAIRQQVAWQAHRPPAKSPAGALVQAIRDAWPPPPAWLEAQAHAATVARRAAEEARRQEEDEARRREWEAKPPEERIAGRLQFWLLGRRAKRQEPTAAEVAAKRAALLAELAVRGAAGPAEPVGCVGCEG
jgi:Helix-turn-helix domain